jgi:serine/threonine-protein kinase
VTSDQRDGQSGEGEGGGHYRFLGLVGQGAMGEIHLATDVHLRRNVAYKTMSPEFAAQENEVGRFLHEARVTAQLDHPNVVPVYALEGDEGRPAYAMKLIEGRTFEDLIEEAKALYDAKKRIDDPHSLTTRLEHFLKVCDALSYAHAMGVIHRDLKPENIMVGPYNEVYVMDWGIAKRVGVPEVPEKAGWFAEDEAVDHDREGYVIGTPAFMSPEQAQGLNDELDARSDQFSLGLILFELVTLQRAYTGKGMETVFRAQEGDLNPIAHHAKRERVPKDLAAIIHKATTLVRDHRYPDVGALADDVRRFQAGEAPLARPDNLWRWVLRTMNRHREATLLAVLMVCLSAAVLVIVALLYVQVNQYFARIREAHLAHILTEVNEQGNAADAYFLEMEGLLEGLSQATVQTLVHARPSPQKLYFNTDFDEEGAGPPDLVSVRRYATPVSFGWPVFKPAPGVDVQAVEPQLQRLVLLRHTFRTLFLRSHGAEALDLSERETVKLLGDRGVPIIWSYVAIEEGMHTSYPGHGGYPDDYDPRRRPWYDVGRKARGPQWGKPYVDVNGQGLILPCVTALRDTEGVFLGVAGIELTLDFIIDEILLTPDLPAVRESFLVDGEGRIVVRSTQLGADVGAGLQGNEALKLEPLPIPEVVEAIRAERAGYLEIDDDLAVYSPLSSLGWYLVVTGETDSLLYGR